ncbi:MAG TPA: proline--tRNA ligase [bacterium]|nr:proline--tRNA ligase [bacterium]
MAKGVTKRSEDFSQWYNDIVKQADLADYGPVKGTMIIKPYGYALWENIKQNADNMFKETGHQNAYFPMFIPQNYMQKEADHVEGFAPECAVVTHGGGKELAEPLYIRPTSETIIWSAYKKWIDSYRDLPLLINQWANVVRWEMRTRLFLRTTEFLWQEGHTAHANADEAIAETRQMIEVYRKLAEEYMAMPVYVGLKTDAEKFAGAEDTYTIEAMMGDKKALQAGTSHYLGQNFAKAFDVTFLNDKNEQEYVYATSWGVSTRLVGGLIMTHGDDHGLILPPKIAPYQVVIIPIWKNDQQKEKVMDKVNEFTAKFKEMDIRFHVDDSEQKSPGWKFNEWEMKGVPLRMEIGPRDLEKNHVALARRDNGNKDFVSNDKVLDVIPKLLDEIQNSMFEKARKFRDDNTHTADNYDDFKKIIKEGGFVKAYWAGDGEMEEEIQKETKATVRCLPLDQPEEEGTCFYTGKKTKKIAIFGKAY